MGKGFYTGTFDIFTNGHLLVVKKALKLFDKVTIVMGVNEKKKRRYDIHRMKKAIEETLELEGISDRVDVIIYEGIIVTEAKRQGATYLIRGVRTVTDYQYEEELAEKNEHLSNEELDTIYIRAGKMGYISSSFVKVLIDDNEEWDISEYVPKPVESLIWEEEKRSV